MHNNTYIEDYDIQEDCGISGNDSKATRDINYDSHSMVKTTKWYNGEKRLWNKNTWNKNLKT